MLLSATSEALARLRVSVLTAAAPGTIPLRAHGILQAGRSRPRYASGATGIGKVENGSRPKADQRDRAAQKVFCPSRIPKTAQRSASGVLDHRTLLAIINPLEFLPVFLRLLEGKDERTHRRIARRACTYAALLTFFFLIFGTLLLEIFEVPLSMVRIVGGIILTRTGFSRFSRPPPLARRTSRMARTEISPSCRAMPLMVGPGAMALARHGVARADPLETIVPGWECLAILPTTEAS